MQIANGLKIIGKLAGWPDLLLFLAILLSLSYCHRNLEIVRPEVKYSASLGEGIDFSKPGTPKFIKRIEGLAGPEPWGRWSDRDKVAIEFTSILPPKFILELEAQGFGPNAGKEATLKFGNVFYKTVLAENPQIYVLNINMDKPTAIIEIFPPSPISPNFLNPQNADTRKLGIGMIKLKIRPI